MKKMRASNYNVDQICVDQIHEFFRAHFGGSTKENTYIPPKKKRRESRKKI